MKTGDRYDWDGTKLTLVGSDMPICGEQAHCGEDERDDHMCAGDEDGVGTCPA